MTPDLGLPRLVEMYQAGRIDFRLEMYMEEM